MGYFFLFPKREFMYRLTEIHWNCPLMVRVGSALYLVFGNIQQAFNVLHAGNILVIDFIFQFELQTRNQVSHSNISKNYLFVQTKGTLCEIALNHTLCHQQRSGLPGDTEEILITSTNSFSSCSFSGLTAQGGRADFCHWFHIHSPQEKRQSQHLSQRQISEATVLVTLLWTLLFRLSRCLFPFCLYSLNLACPFILSLPSFQPSLPLVKPKLSKPLNPQCWMAP